MWRAIDANGHLVDFRLTARRDGTAAKAFLDKGLERVRLHLPVSICTDKAPTYRQVIRDINHCYNPLFDYITHNDRKYLNNRFESDHVALERLLGYRQSFRSLRSAEATLLGMKTIRTIKNGHVNTKQPGVRGEIAFVCGMFGLAAKLPQMRSKKRQSTVNATVLFGVIQQHPPSPNSRQTRLDFGSHQSGSVTTTVGIRVCRPESPGCA